MAAALGMAEGGNAILRTTASKGIGARIDKIDATLSSKTENSVIFRGLQPGARADFPIAKQPIAHGYDSTILIDVCKAITEAEIVGKLTPPQANLAKRAKIILHSSAKSGIKNLDCSWV